MTSKKSKPAIVLSKSVNRKIDALTNRLGKQLWSIVKKELDAVRKVAKAAA